MTNVVELILRARDQASAVVGKVEKRVGGLTATIEKHEKAIKRAGVAGAAMTAGLLAAAKGAETQRKTQAQLAAVVDATGESYARLEPHVEKTISALQAQTAVSDELQREVLSKLVVQTGSLDKAMAALPAVLDTAAASGRDVNAVAETLGKALAGTSNMAESLGIQFDKTATFSERLDIVMGKVGGTAAATATTSAKLQAALGDMSDAVGTALLPHLERLAVFVTGLIEKFNGLDERLQALVAGGAGIAALVLALTPLLTLLPAIATGVKAVSIAMAFLAANPIVLVSAAVAALVVLLVQLNDELAINQATIGKMVKSLTQNKQELLNHARANRLAREEAAELSSVIDRVNAGLDQQAASLVGEVTPAVEEYAQAWQSVEEMNAEFLASLETTKAAAAQMQPAIAGPIEAGVDSAVFALSTLPPAMQEEMDAALSVASQGVDAINATLAGIGPPGATGLSGSTTLTKDQLLATIAGLQEKINSGTNFSGIGEVAKSSLENAKQALEDLNNASSVQGPGTFASSFGGGGGGPGALSTAIGGQGLTNYGTMHFNGIANPMEVLEVLDPLGAA